MSKHARVRRVRDCLLLTGGGGNAGLFVGDVTSGRVEPIVIQDGPAGQTKPQRPRMPAVSPDSSLVAMVVAPLNVITGPVRVSVFDLKRHVRQPIEASQGADSEIPLVWQP